ncbi:MAG: hypothetical protein IKB09_10725 [Oscillospiraceae bacterium]|nr:hypothetical protein [Oscillospiraceae bacterium]
MKRIICVLLSVCMLLCLAACGEDPEPTPGTTAPAAPTESTAPTKEQVPEPTEEQVPEPTEEQIPETTEATQPSVAVPTTEPTVPTEAWEDPSLVIFRQAMVETPQLFAAAFFGYVPLDADPFAIMQEAAPQLCEDLPFLLTIGKENIMGTYGYLFCIVPADEYATVAVNRRPWNAETQSYEEPEVLYRSESGSPILVMCPNEDWIPDTEVVFTDSNGTVTVWSPYLDPSYHLSALLNDNGESLIFDFTSYDELPNPGWNQRIDNSELVGTWELAWTEVEGDRNEAAPGVCTIEITPDETGFYRFTYTNRDFPGENIRDRELLVDPGELYPGCGNDQWIGKVTAESADPVQYALTLLEDGMLLLQTYWEMDGMPWVSYGWYARTG